MVNLIKVESVSLIIDYLTYFKASMDKYSAKYKQDLQVRYKSSILDFFEQFREIRFPEMQYFSSIYVVEKPWIASLEKTDAGVMYQAHTKDLTHIKNQ